MDREKNIEEMNNNCITVRIITPARQVTKIDARLATFPGEEGEFGVMPGHMLMVASLKPGLLRIEGIVKEQCPTYFIFGGLAQIKVKEVNVITEYAVDIEQISKIIVQEKITELKNLAANTEISKIKYEQELQYLNLLANFLT